MKTSLGIVWVMLICGSFSFAQSKTISTVLGEFELRRLGSYAAGDDYYTRLVEDGAHYMFERLGPLELVGWTIMITEEQADMKGVSGSPLPDWIPAVTLPQRKVIVMLVPGAGSPPIERDRFETTLLHELTHAYLYEAVTAEVFATVPDWYIEGLAGYISGQAYRGLFYPLVNGGFNNRIKPLRLLEHIHLLSQTGSELAYAQAYFAMLLMEDLYGLDIHYNMLEYLSQDNVFAEAFLIATGVPPPIFDQQYLRILERRFNPWLWLISPRFMFVLFPLMVIVAFVIRRHRMRLQMEVLAREDMQISAGEQTGELPSRVEQILARSDEREKM